MARRSGAMTPEKIKRRIKEGRGQNSGGDYRPWITVQDFSSRGQANRELGWKTGRQHDLHSKEEREYFLILEWSPIVIDIQEQFPLPPLVCVRICEFPSTMTLSVPLLNVRVRPTVSRWH